MDFMMWLLNQHAADAAAWVRRTECNYLWGEGGCGKDVLAGLLMAFFGDRKTGGYVACFPHNYFVGKCTKSDIKSVLDTAKGARLVINNEVPEHSFMNHDEMKPLTESRGTGITSRKVTIPYLLFFYFFKNTKIITQSTSPPCRTIYALPETWQPMCGVLMMGNYRTMLSHKQTKDTGIKRRLNVKKLTGTYSADEEKDVKAEIESGIHNRELFWLLRVCFTRYLSKLPLSWTRIQPRPPKVVAETEELFNTALLDQVKDWIEEYTIPALSYPKASNIVAVKKALAKLTGYDYQPAKNDAEFSELLKSYGLEEARNGACRVMTYLYPDTLRRKGVKLLSEMKHQKDGEQDDED